eukprot:TRINITY_DN382_c0_g1_i5.p1 TRINITY_DN382_c0_g1~~TRINITY_DN382_c0_g1_i5.p1  ORF type:complete len:802 (-),score=191.57 TRINITY_DN382_c0_g1_i5:1102-3507(-)
MAAILAENELFRRQLLELPGLPWIPGPMGVSLSKGIGSSQGDLLETDSPFGALMRVSTLPGLERTRTAKEANERLYAKLKEDLEGQKRKSVVETRMRSFGDMLRNYNDSLKRIVKAMLRDPMTKGEILRWFAAGAFGNPARAKLGRRLQKVDKNLKKTSSDALSLNAFDILLDLCLPFFDKPEMSSKIDPTYYSATEWLRSLGETPMTSKKPEGLRLLAVNPFRAEYGTITEYFFLAVTHAHFGLLPCLTELMELGDELRNLEDELKRLDKGHRLYRAAEERSVQVRREFLAYRTTLFEETRTRAVNGLYDLVARLLFNWSGIDPRTMTGGSPAGEWALPDIFLVLPDYWITDLVEYHVTHLQHRGEDHLRSLTSSQLSTLLNFVVWALAGVPLISNPYTRGKAVELTAILCLVSADRLREAFVNEPSCLNNLTAQLIRFYVDIENTGASNQYYAKYQYRHQVAIIFKVLWKSEEYKNALIKLGKTSSDFERFINAVLSDAGFCMDEGFENLKKGEKLEEKRDAGGVLTEEEEKTLDQSMRGLKSLMGQTAQCVEILANLSAWTPQSIVAGDFKRRLGTTINYLAAQLVARGSRLTGKRFGTDPAAMLRCVITIYVNLAHDSDFVEVVATDERSFSAANMAQTLKIADSAGLSEDLFNGFQAFVQAALRKGDEKRLLDQILKDAPDEFQCPLSGEVMRDPVKLPNSSQVCDRSMIKQALLDNAIDPFTRTPLKIEQVIEMPQLKAQIEAWIAARIAEHRKTKMDVEAFSVHRQSRPNNTAVEEEKVDEDDASSIFASRRLL